jgi:hypothetical protein
MEELLFQLLLAVVTVIAGAIGRFVIPWIKEKVEGTKFQNVCEWTETFVAAAEQYIKTGGPDKKTYVAVHLKNLLKSKKLSLSDEQLNALIESTVNELFPKIMDGEKNV